MRMYRVSYIIYCFCIIVYFNYSRSHTDPLYLYKQNTAYGQPTCSAYHMFIGPGWVSDQFTRCQFSHLYLMFLFTSLTNKDKNAI